MLCIFLPLSGAYGSSISAGWTGSGGDSSWSTPGNWTPSGAPNNNGSNTFGVTIGPPGATVDLPGSITVDSLTMNSSTLSMSGGPNSLTLATGPSSLTNSNIVGGTFTSNGTLTLSATTFNTTLNNNGTINMASGVNALSGTLNNSGAASINVANAAYLELETGGSYTNNGTITVNSSALAVDTTPANGASGTAVTLSGTGTLTLNSSTIQENGVGLTLANGVDHTIQGSGTIVGAGFTLINYGTINANQATQLMVVAGSITNSRTMEATGPGGLEIVADAVNNAGGSIVANGSTVTLQGPLSASSEVITGGAVNVINGGVLTANTGLTSMQGVTLTIDGTSNASVGGTIAGGSTVNNSGTLTLSAATFNSSTLNNSGTITAGTGTMPILSGALNNSAAGNINVAGAALMFEAGGSYTNNGTITIGSSSALGAVVLDATAAAGASGTTVTLGGTGTLTLNEAGVVEPGQNLAPGTGVTLDNGAGHTIQGSGSLGNEAGLTIINQGTINANQTTNLIVTAGSITNSGLMEATGAGGLGIETNSVNNAGGTIVANGSTVTLQGPITASSEVITGGAVNVINGGTLLVANTAMSMQGVTLTVDKTSTALLGGTIAGGSTINNSGTVTLTDTTFNSSTLNNSGTILAGGQNTLGGTVVNSAGANINIAGGAGLELKAGGSYSNAGTVNIAGTLQVDSGANLTNFQGGTLTGGAYDVTGTMDFYVGDVVTNQAAITMSGSSSLWASDASGTNGLSDFTTNGSQGQFSLLNGASLQSGGDFTNSGAVTIGAGSDFTAASAGTGDYTQTAGSTIVNGTLQAADINLNGGAISGTGTLIGNVVNGGSVDPGDAPGTLTVNGNYTQAADGVLDIEIDGASDYDQLFVTGNAQLNGTLNIAFGGGFSPYEFETFNDVMTFTSVSGNFSNVEPAGNWVEIWTSDTLSLEYVTPEPSTWVLLAFGLIGFGCLRRRAGARA